MTENDQAYLQALKALKDMKATSPEYFEAYVSGIETACKAMSEAARRLLEMTKEVHDHHDPVR